MFLGRYSYAVDGKGRLAIPARFRAPLAGGLVLTRGFDRCLTLYPLDAWTPLAERIDALSIADPDGRAFRRQVFAEAADLELDGQGRILLPGALRAYAGIEREAVVVGVHSFVEIWNAAEWESMASTSQHDVEAIAKRLASLI
ncbi:division/cell wall cluster transcriptional repressor MraZ [soil metagenome]